jgi:hypothetical protein
MMTLQKAAGRLTRLFIQAAFDLRVRPLRPLRMRVLTLATR